MQEKEKWINRILSSMKGSHKAQPKASLFEEIERTIHSPKGKGIPLYQRQVAIAASLALFVLNSYAIYHFTQNQEQSNTELMENTGDDLSIISNYQIYD